jgi:transposase
LLGVEQWAEIRRMSKVELLWQREIRRRTGVHRDTIRKALASPVPPSCGPRPARASKLDPFGQTIEELLADEPTLSGVRIREELEQLGYDGGKTILGDLLRELRPRFLPPPRSFQRTRYRPGELARSTSASRARRSRSAGARPGVDGSSPVSCPTRAPSPARWCSRRSSQTSPSG